MPAPLMHYWPCQHVQMYAGNPSSLHCHGKLCKALCAPQTDNVLIWVADGSFMAKVADVGLARSLPPEKSYLRTDTHGAQPSGHSLCSTTIAKSARKLLQLHQDMLYELPGVLLITEWVHCGSVEVTGPSWPAM